MVTESVKKVREIFLLKIYKYLVLPRYPIKYLRLTLTSPSPHRSGPLLGRIILPKVKSQKFVILLTSSWTSMGLKVPGTHVVGLDQVSWRLPEQCVCVVYTFLSVSCPDGPLLKSPVFREVSVKYNFKLKTLTYSRERGF